jgi:hypothetical protein
MIYSLPVGNFPIFVKVFIYTALCKHLNFASVENEIILLSSMLTAPYVFPLKLKPFIINNPEKLQVG